MKMRRVVLRLAVAALLTLVMPGCWFLDLFDPPQKGRLVEKGPPPAPTIDSFKVTHEGRELAGNEWTLPVGNGIEIEAAMSVRLERPLICGVLFKLTPASGDSSHAIRVLLQEERTFRFGRHVFKVAWDGKTANGKKAPPGQYQLFGELRTHPASCDDQTSWGHEGFGLGKLKMARADGKATPDYTGPGAAGVCGLVNPGEVVTVFLELDVPMPRCVVVTGRQRLRVVNRFAHRVVVQLGGLEFVVSGKGSMTVDKSFNTYLTPGGYFMKIKNGYGAEIRYES